MNIEEKIKLTVETQAIGDVVSFVPYDGCKEDGRFVLKIPNRHFLGTDYTNLDLTEVLNHDIECFEKLNRANDEAHQVYIDTLCVYGVAIKGPFIRIDYWFNQDRKPESHRMCSGVLTHFVSKGNFTYREDAETVVYPELYSNDVRVYW